MTAHSDRVVLTPFIKAPVEAPGTLALLLPTRGRPQWCERLFASIVATAAHPQRLFVRCLVDHDDAESQRAIERVRSSYPFRVDMLVSGPTRTQGERYNALRAQLRPFAELYMPLADDVVFSTPGWDQMIFDAFAAASGTTLMCYPEDDTVGPDQATYPIVHADWTNSIGHYASGWFPFWFEDVWMDKVAELLGEKRLLHFRMKAPEGKGKTQGMRNLPFWDYFFHNTLEDRVAEALEIVRTNPRLSPQERLDRERRVEENAKAMLSRTPVAGEDELRRVERDLSGTPADSQPGAKYLQCEAAALWYLTQKVRSYWNSGRITTAALLLRNIALSSPQVRDFGSQALLRGQLGEGQR